MDDPMDDENKATLEWSSINMRISVSGTPIKEFQVILLRIENTTGK